MCGPGLSWPWKRIPALVEGAIEGVGDRGSSVQKRDVGDSQHPSTLAGSRIRSVQVEAQHRFRLALREWDPCGYRHFAPEAYQTLPSYRFFDGTPWCRSDRTLHLGAYWGGNCWGYACAAGIRSSDKRSAGLHCHAGHARMGDNPG